MYQKLTLPNGVRIVTDAMPAVRSCSVGVWVGVGSRYEKYGQAGAAHFIEHMLFKGTSRYTAAQLAEEMDNIGGQVNAYTTRDTTCFYARVLDTHLPLAIDILSDMFFDSLFAESDVANERAVIGEEIDMYEDTPEDVAAELLLRKVFPGALGRGVLGRRGSLAAMTGESLRAFKDANYTPARIVIAMAGSFTQADVDRAAERFSVLPGARLKKPAAAGYTPAFVSRRKPIEQSQLVLGFPGLTVADPRRFAMQLFSGILGGSSSSRLFQTVREKYGLCYSIYSFSAGYTDTGLLAVAAAVGRDTEAQALELVLRELRRLKDEGVSAAELERAREQAKAGLLMSLESSGSRMNRLGFGELFLGGCMTPEQITASYDAVSLGDMGELADSLLDFRRASLSAVGRGADAERYRELLK